MHLLSINETLFTNSLYRVQSQIRTLTNSLEVGVPLYTQYTNTENTLKPSVLQSKIDKFQQENLLLNQYMNNLWHRSQLEQEIIFPPAPSLGEPVSEVPSSEPIAEPEALDAYSQLTNMWLFVVKMPLTLRSLEERRSTFLQMNENFKTASDATFHLQDIKFDEEAFKDEFKRQYLLDDITSKLNAMGGGPPDIHTVVQPPANSDYDYQKTEQYIKLREMWDFAQNMEMTDVLFNNPNEVAFKKLSDAFSLITHYKYDLFNTHAYKSSQWYFRTENGRNVLLSIIGENLNAMKMDAENPPVSPYDLNTKPITILNDMLDFAQNMTVLRSGTISGLQQPFLEMNNAFKAVTDEKYHLETTHGFTDVYTMYYKRDSDKNALIAMIQDNIAALERDTVEEPEATPPIVEPPLPNGNNDFSEETVSELILSIKKEYNTNQIQVHTNEYNRLMQTHEAKTSSELAKFRLLEQNNFWLLNNEKNRQLNLSSLLNL